MNKLSTFALLFGTLFIIVWLSLQTKKTVMDPINNERSMLIYEHAYLKGRLNALRAKTDAESNEIWKKDSITFVREFLDQ